MDSRGLHLSEGKCCSKTCLIEHPSYKEMGNGNLPIVSLSGRFPRPTDLPADVPGQLGQKLLVAACSEQPLCGVWDPWFPHFLHNAPYSYGQECVSGHDVFFSTVSTGDFQRVQDKRVDISALY